MPFSDCRQEVLCGPWEKDICGVSISTQLNFSDNGKKCPHSQDYAVNVGFIGRLEVDFIARRLNEGYTYIQVSLSVADPDVVQREYRPFRQVRDNWPQYLLTLDPLPEGRDGVSHLNLMELMATNGEL